MLATLCAALFMMQGGPVPSSFGFTVPKAKWIMLVRADGFLVSRQQVTPEGTGGYFLLAEKGTGFTASIFIEPPGVCASAVECRDRAWRLTEPTVKGARNLLQRLAGEAAITEFLLPEFHGLKVNQQNLNAHYSKDGFWIDLRITKTNYHDPDHARLEAIINGVSFKEKAGGA